MCVRKKLHGRTTRFLETISLPIRVRVGNDIKAKTFKTKNENKKKSKEKKTKWKRARERDKKKYGGTCLIGQCKRERKIRILNND